MPMIAMSPSAPVPMLPCWVMLRSSGNDPRVRPRGVRAGRLAAGALGSDGALDLGRRRGLACASSAPETARQRLDRRVLEQLDESGTRVACVAQARWTGTISSEVPPRSKKLSFSPTASIPSTSRQTAATARSRAARGCVAGLAEGRAGQRWQALRIDLAVGRQGEASRRTKRDGTMYPGKRFAEVEHVRARDRGRRPPWST